MNTFRRRIVFVIIVSIVAYCTVKVIDNFEWLSNRMFFFLYSKEIISEIPFPGTGEFTITMSSFARIRVYNNNLKQLIVSKLRSSRYVQQLRKRPPNQLSYIDTDGVVHCIEWDYSGGVRYRGDYYASDFICVVSEIHEFLKLKLPEKTVGFFVNGTWYADPIHEQFNLFSDIDISIGEASGESSPLRLNCLGLNSLVVGVQLFPYAGGAADG